MRPGTGNVIATVLSYMDFRVNIVEAAKLGAMTAVETAKKFVILVVLLVMTSSSGVCAGVDLGRDVAVGRQLARLVRHALGLCRKCDQHRSAQGMRLSPVVVSARRDASRRACQQIVLDLSINSEVVITIGLARGVLERGSALHPSSSSILLLLIL